MKPTIFSYTRWSSKGQAQGDSEKRQIEAASRWCASRGFTLAATEIDNGVSAKAGKNRADGSGLSRLLAKASQGDYLLVEDNDRLSREDWLTASNFIRDITAKGVTVVTLQNGNEITHERFLQDPGCFLPSVLRSFTGNDENRKKSIRVKAAWATKRQEIAEGRAIRQRLPGWLSHEKTFVGGKTILGKIILDEAKAETIREIFKLTLAGMSVRRIAQKLNDAKVPSVSGQATHWNGQSLHATIIRNPAVIGDYRSSDGTVTKGIFPRIVSDETFYAANARATGLQKQTSRRPELNLVTGLVRCPQCGGAMRLNRKYKGDGKIYAYLHCSANFAGRTDCDVRPNYYAFESGLLSLMSDSTKLRAAMGKPAGEASELVALRGKVEASDSKLNQLMALLEETPSKALAAKVATLEAEGETLREQLQTAEATAKATTPPDKAYDRFVNELGDKLNEPAYREQIKTSLKDIIDHIQITGKYGFLVHFKGSAQPIEVIMPENAVKVQEIRQIGEPVLVP